MALNYRKFQSLDDLTLFLKGHIIGGVNLLRTGGSLYLHGRTLVFNTPAETVTFAATPANAQVPLTLAEVKAQIEAQTTGMVARINKGHLELFMSTPGTINLDSTGTANALLGYDTAADTIASPYGVPGGAAPALVTIVPDSSSNSYLVVVNDT